MKRWIACLLSLCLCVTPVLAGAQSISTEALLGQLLGRFAAQLESPSLGMTAKMPEEMFDLCFALDEQGFPDLSFGVQGKWGAVRYDADASGLRFDDGVKKVGMTIETLLRVLNTDENGMSMGPVFTQADAELFAAMAEEIIAASGSAATRILRELPAAGSGAAAGAQASAVQQVTTVDIVRLLAIWDKEIPAALVRHAPAINDFMMRSEAFFCEMLGVSALPSAEQLALNWPKPGFSGLIPEGMPAVVVIEQTADAQAGMTMEISAQLGDMQLAEVISAGGHVYGWLGSEAYAFDSRDLQTAAALLAQIPRHISKEALDFTYNVYEREAIVVHLNLDAERLMEDLVGGAVYVWQSGRTKIERLLDRYTPWLEIFGLYGADRITWENALEQMLDVQDGVAQELCQQLRWRLNRSGLGAMLFGREAPCLKLDAVIPLRTENMPVASLDIRTNMTRYDFSLSSGHLSSILETYDYRGLPEQKTLRGSFAEGYALLTYAKDRPAQKTAGWQFEWEAQEKGWIAELRDHEQALLAEMVCEGEHICLTADNLRADLTLSPEGFTLSGFAQGKPFGAEFATAEGTTRLYADSGAWMLRLMMIEEPGIGTVQASLQNRLRFEEFRFEARTDADSLCMNAGAYRADVETFAAKLDVQMKAGMPYVHTGVNAIVSDDETEYRETEITYMPGMLDVGVRNPDTKESVDVRISDVTRQDFAGNETRVDLLVKEKRGERLHTSDETWTAKTDVQGDVYTTQIFYGEKECLTLALDFAAKPQAQELSGYTWLTEEETREIIREAMATPTPAPTAEPQVTPEPESDAM